MHDTPTKNLFNNEARAYSHGCVRLRNPVRLAALVLGADKGWTEDKINNLVEDGPEDNSVKLDAKIPVHITYFTALVDDAGRVQTFADVYGHELRITQALDGRKDQISKLNPPVNIPRAVVNADGISARALERQQRRRTVEYFNLPPPAALGFKPSFQAPAYNPPPKSAGRSRGNSTNDIIMRQLGGGF